MLLSSLIIFLFFLLQPSNIIFNKTLRPNIPYLFSELIKKVVSVSLLNTNFLRVWNTYSLLGCGTSLVFVSSNN